MSNLENFADKFFHYSPQNRPNRIQHVINQFIAQEGKNPIRVKQVSALTNIEHTLPLNLFAEQLLKWRDGAKIQQVMPHLSADEREFLINGTYPGEFEATFGTDDE